jgi:hypothetical protein
MNVQSENIRKEVSWPVWRDYGIRLGRLSKTVNPLYKNSRMPCQYLSRISSDCIYYCRVYLRRDIERQKCNMKLIMVYGEQKHKSYVRNYNKILRRTVLQLYNTMRVRYTK